MSASHLSPLIYLLILLVHVKSDPAVQFEKCHCIVHDPDAVQNVTCVAKAINRTTALINMKGTIVRQMNNVFVNIQMNKRSEITYRPFLINITESYCDFFAKNRASKYMRIITAVYLPYTNLNHTCPYFGFVYIKDLPIDMTKVPSVWPIGNYRLDVLSIENNKNIITMQIFFEMKERTRYLSRKKFNLNF